MGSEYKENDNSLWKSTENNNYHIKFRNNKKGNLVRVLLLFIIFILIAVTSGAITSDYIIKKRYPELEQNVKRDMLKDNKEKGSSVQNEPITGNAITKVAETVGPAVVAISNRAEGFFGDVRQGTGSGIIFDEEGYIVTNYHVIERASKITVKLSGGKELYAKVIGADPKSDLAIIKINAKNLPVAKFGDSSNIRVGDLAIAIGNPLGEEFAGSVTAGIVSALNRRIVVGESVYKVLQTDAAINPGNSGGALCNESGEVIGINSLKLGAESNAEGMGFAIAINEAKTIIDELMKHGKVSRPIIGIYGGTVNPEASSGVEGVFVSKVIPESGADKSGIKVEDIIVEFGNKKIKEFKELSQILEEHKVGDVISCKVWRNGSVIKIKIRLCEME